ncbi:MAG: iron-containing alcohol dehydrogenase [Oscillospiraceae bacterium]|jgi:alcohol dehydrogenase class IV|nr:iron-containing alcohol dehydrogenase [Oscillospiraceae bacterium]
MSSVWSSPNPLLFGRGKAGETGNELRKLGCKKALVVFDRGVESAGIAGRVIAVIEAAGVSVVAFNEVQADPPDWSVEAAGALGAAEGVDCVVGVGGGSSIDTAKAAKLLITNPPPLKQYYGRDGVVTKPSVPLIVIPTTAGTGSECTPGGVITDTERGIKTNIAGVGCSVTLGIVDPELTYGLPKAVTASTGMDALCHCIESYTSARANPFSGVAGREGIDLVAKYLVRACEDGSDAQAREGMMLASSLGGIAMSGALCHLSHDIGRSLGAKFHVPHGNGCAACLPQVLWAVAPVKTAQVRYFAESFGETLAPDDPADEVGLAAYRAARELMARIGLPNMKALGLDRAQLLSAVPDEVVMQCEMAARAGFVTSPVPVSRELIADIVSRAYDEN